MKQLPWLIIFSILMVVLSGCELTRSTESDIVAPLAPPASAADSAAGVTLQSTGATISVQPVSQQTALGGNVTVEIRVSNITNLAGFDIELRFDPAMLQAVDADPNQDGMQVQPGDFLAANFVVQNSINNQTGVVNYVLTQVAPTPPVSGEGVLMRLTFTAINAGTSPIAFSRVQLASGEAQPIDAAQTNGEIIISAAGTPVTPLPATATPTPTTPTPTLLPGTTPVVLTSTPLPTEQVIVQDTATPTATPTTTSTPTATFTPPPTATFTPTPTPTTFVPPSKVYIPPDATWGFCYRAIPGEDIYVLSRKFNTPPEAIQRANDLNPPFYIKAQQTLFIPVMPGNGPNVYDVKIGDTLEVIAERCKLPVSMLAQVNNLAETAPLFVPAGSPIQQPDGTTVIVREATLTIPGLVIPIPPFPPPTRYRYPTGPIPIVPYSEPYPQYKDPLTH